MFYMLGNVHHKITTHKVLPPPNRFWYYLPDLPFGIQNTTMSFQLDLEHLISCNMTRGAILSSIIGSNIPSL